MKRIKLPKWLKKEIDSRLTFIRDAGKNKWSQKLGLYRCECGNEKVILCYSVRTGAIKSCSCLQKEMTKIKGKKNRTHGLSRHPLYQRWGAMKDRCYNPNFDKFHRYGGRGITMCDEWLNDPIAFMEWGLANGWELGLHLHRIDNDKGYSPDNCEFLSAKEHYDKHRK